jgi:hypothetical protein
MFLMKEFPLKLKRTLFMVLDDNIVPFCMAIGVLRFCTSYVQRNNPIDRLQDNVERSCFKK